MKVLTTTGRWAGTALLLLAGCPRGRAFLGVGDTSFVTVIANPADDAHWVSELDSLARQLVAVRGTLQEVTLVRAYAGDPGAAAAAVGSLAVTGQALATMSAAPATAADFQVAWSGQSAGIQAQVTGGVLAGAGLAPQMQVFGQTQPRNLDLYARFGADGTLTAGLREQIAAEQGARTAVAQALNQGWADFQSAQTESQKQAILARITQLQTQSQVLEAHRRALLDDLTLADRQGRAQGQLRAEAGDESALAESAALAAATTARAAAAMAQRSATLQKTPARAAAADYSGLRLWTTADTASGP